MMGLLQQCSFLLVKEKVSLVEAMFFIGSCKNKAIKTWCPQSNIWHDVILRQFGEYEKFTYFTFFVLITGTMFSRYRMKKKIIPHRRYFIAKTLHRDYSGSPWG